MAKFCKKSVIIEAVQFFDTTESITEIESLTRRTVVVNHEELPVHAKIYMRHDVLIAYIGDWVVMDEYGELYVLKAEDFEKSYSSTFIESPAP